MKALIDTDILVDFFHKNDKARKVFEELALKENSAGVSVITVGELFAGKECLDEKRERLVEKTLNYMPYFGVNSQIARKAGEFCRNYNVKLDDALIASTAFNFKLILFTRNIKDFSKIKEISVKKPY